MPAPFDMAESLTGLPGIRHAFFGRPGGVSSGVYAGLNISQSTGDDPALVERNRATVAQTLGYGPEALARVRQVHSADVVTLLTPPGSGPRVEADAMVTALPGVILGIQTADCAPILLADAKAGIIGAAHAGWKGAVGGIIGNTIEAMKALGADPKAIHAAIGPTISGVNYEVGEDFKAAILARYPDAEAFFRPGENGTPHFDLPAFVRARLEAAGVGAITVLDACTYGAPEKYFSHRYATHQGTTTGRQISTIVRADGE